MLARFSLLNRAITRSLQRIITSYLRAHDFGFRVSYEEKHSQPDLFANLATIYKRISAVKSEQACVKIFIRKRGKAGKTLFKKAKDLVSKDNLERVRRRGFRFEMRRTHP